MASPLAESLAAGDREAFATLYDRLTVDVGSPVVAAMLARHATTLDVVRRAADRPGCRFARDWTRPSFFMTVDEVQYLRQAARLPPGAEDVEGNDDVGLRMAR